MTTSQHTTGILACRHAVWSRHVAPPTDALHAARGGAPATTVDPDAATRQTVPQCQKLPAQPSGRHYHRPGDNTGSTTATCHAQNLHRLRRIRQPTGLPPEPLRGVHLPRMPGGRHPAFTAPHRTPYRNLVAPQAVAGYPVCRACRAAAVGLLHGGHEGQLFPAGPKPRRNLVRTIAMQCASGRVRCGRACRACRAASGYHPRMPRRAEPTACHAPFRAAQRSHEHRVTDHHRAARIMLRAITSCWIWLVPSYRRNRRTSR